MTTMAPSAAASATSMNNSSMILPVSITEDGPIGMTLQATDKEAGAIITSVIPGKQADRAGILLGDIPVFGGGVSAGKKIPFRAALQMCKARPLDKFFAVMRPAAKSGEKTKQLVATQFNKKQLSAYANDLQKENVPNGASTAAKMPSKTPTGAGRAPFAAAAGAVATGGGGIVESTSELLAMNKTELHNQLTLRGIQWGKSAVKDDLHELLGIPVKRWHAYRKMKLTELKEELKKQNKKITGNKYDLLLRLGMPDGFGESSYEASARKFREMERKDRADKKKQQKMDGRMETGQKMDSRGKKAALYGCRMMMNAFSREDRNKVKYQTKWETDPTDEHYEIPCCKNPRINLNGESAGCITWPGGSMSEVWRCQACGKIPEQPNAPPIEEFSSDDECDMPGRPECVIQ